MGQHDLHKIYQTNSHRSVLFNSHTTHHVKALLDGTSPFSFPNSNDYSGKLKCWKKNSI